MYRNISKENNDARILLRRLAFRANHKLQNMTAPSQRDKLSGIPGEWILRLSDEERELLSHLRSEDLEGEDLIYVHIPY